MLDNPYVGPTAFTENDSTRFFGRTEETRELASLVIARRAVLLYAQSGSGKTSLLQASLIPELKRHKRVETFPIARVMGSDADLASGNLYVKNALTNLFPDAPHTQTFSEAFGAVLSADPKGRRQPHLVIFDQFEEIFTFHPELTDQRTAFFQQLGECLDTYPQLSLLLSMREDYLADLEANVAFLPDRMRTRMRLERLGVENSLEAIREPAAIAGMPFAAGAAEELVDNLRRIRTGASGANGFALGQYVEPVQLQIVCRQLWSRLMEDTARQTAQIDAGDIAKYANVDDALIQFYHDALARAQQAGLTERLLRLWFGERLITPAGTRGLVYRGERETEGLPNAAVDILRDCYIIRADLRGENTWYELAHDRLVEPVREDNLAWKAGYRNPVAGALERGSDHLLTGTGLADGLRFARDNPQELTPEERLFLRKSDEAERRARTLRRRLIGSAVAVILALSILTAWSLKNASKAATQKTEAQKEKSEADKQTAKAQYEKSEADIQRNEAQNQKSEAQKQLVKSLVNSGSGLVSTNTEFDDLAAMVAALRAEKTFRALSKLPFSGSVASPELGAEVQSVLRKVVYGIHERNRLSVGDEVVTARFNRAGTRIAAIDRKGKVYTWDRSGRKLFEFQGPPGSIVVGSAAFTVDLDFLVTSHVSVDPKKNPNDQAYVILDSCRALIWDVKGHRQRAELAPLGGCVVATAIDPGGRFIATAGLGGLRIWSLQGVELKWGTFPELATKVTFSPEGKRLAWRIASLGLPTTAEEGIRILDLDNPGAGSTLMRTTAAYQGAEAVSSLAFVPGKEQLVEGTGQKWDLKTFRPIENKKVGNAIIYSADGELVGVDLNGTPKITTSDGNQIALLTVHNKSGIVQAFGPGRLILTYWDDKKLRIWDLSSRFAAEFKTDINSPQMDFSDTPRFYATAGLGDNAITLWSPEGRVLGEFPKFPGGQGAIPLSRFWLSQDSTMLMVCYAGGSTCTLWDTKTKLSQVIPLQGDMVGIMNVSGKPALVSIDGVAVRAQDGSGPARTLFSLPERPASIMPNPARTRLVFAFPSGVGVWDLSGHRVSGFLKELGASVIVLPGSDVQRVGITWSDARNTSVYDQSGKLIAAFGFGQWAEGLSPDGKLLAVPGSVQVAPGDSGRVTLWDVETKKPFAQFLGDGGYGARFTPDGKFLTVLSSDVLPRLWRVENTEELVAAGCKWIGDYLRNNSDVGPEDRKLCEPQTR